MPKALSLHRSKGTVPPLRPLTTGAGYTVLNGVVAYGLGRILTCPYSPGTPGQYDLGLICPVLHGVGPTHVKGGPWSCTQPATLPYLGLTSWGHTLGCIAVATACQTNGSPTLFANAAVIAIVNRQASAMLTIFVLAQIPG